MSRFLQVFAPLAILLALVASGCSKGPQNRLAGSYLAKPELTPQGTALIEKKMGPKAAAAKKQIADTAINLELRSDMTFTMTTTGPSASTNSGKWTDMGDKILLSLSAAGVGTGANGGVMALTVSKDLKTLSPEKGDNGAAAQMETLTFNRTTPVPTATQ